MRAESGLVGTAIGASLGVLGWVVGLGKLLWPEHPQWALSLIVVAVATISMVIIERNEHRRANRAQN